jgi:uncharacterized protein
MSLPKFPEFIALRDISEDQILPYTKGFPAYSDFTYSNLWSWNIDNSFKVSDLYGNLVIQMRDPKTKEFFLSLHGISNIDECLCLLFNATEALNISSVLSLIPEETAEIARVGEFEVIEDRDNFDYIYSTLELSELKGKSFKSKRHLVNQFTAQYPNFVIEHAELTPSTKLHILKFMSAENKKRSAYGYTPFVEYEMAALEHFFLLPHNKNMVASFLIAENKLLGFTIDELLHDSYALSHFFKVDSDYKGVYDTLNMYTAKYLYERGATNWNWVEDVGSEGLRQAKLSYRPIRFLKKFTIQRINIC